LKHAALGTPGGPWTVWQFLHSPWWGPVVKLTRPASGALADRPPVPGAWQVEHAAAVSVIVNWCFSWQDAQARCRSGTAVATSLALAVWQPAQTLGGGSGF